MFSTVISTSYHQFWTPYGAHTLYTILRICRNMVKNTVYICKYTTLLVTWDTVKPCMSSRISCMRCSLYVHLQNAFNVLNTLFRHLPAPFYIIQITECKNYPWNSFYGTRNSHQIGLRHYPCFFLPNFQFLRFLAMFSCYDIFENWYEYSLNQYLDTFIFWFFK